MAISGTAGVQIASQVPVVGSIVNVGANVYDAVTRVFGGGAPPPFKQVWAAVPFDPNSRGVTTKNFLRLSGGHGRWTDQLTGEVTDDKGSDVRKVACCASGMDMYVDANLRMYFNRDGRSVEPADSWNAWLTRFGNVSFAQAYAANPGAFRVFNATSQGNDPAIGRPPTPDASVQALPVSYTPVAAPAAPNAFTPLPAPVATPSQPVGQSSAATPANAPAQAAPLPFYKTPLGIGLIALGVFLLVRGMHK